MAEGLHYPSPPSVQEEPRVPEHDQSSDPVIAQLREQISETDLAILDSVNKRVALVQRLHEYKREQGYSLTDTAREDWIVQYLQRCNRGPISPDEVSTLIRFVLDQTRRETIRLRGE
jgi:chorismate mutase